MKAAGGGGTTTGGGSTAGRTGSTGRRLLAGRGAGDDGCRRRRGGRLDPGRRRCVGLDPGTVGDHRRWNRFRDPEGGRGGRRRGDGMLARGEAAAEPPQHARNEGGDRAAGDRGEDDDEPTLVPRRLDGQGAQIVGRRGGRGLDLLERVEDRAHEVPPPVAVRTGRW